MLIVDNKHCFIESFLGHAAGGAIGWDTALQTRRSRVRFPMVSLEFFFDVTLPATLDSASNRNEYQEYFLGEKAVCAEGWKPYYLHAPIVFQCGSLNLLQPSGPVQACNGIALPYLEDWYCTLLQKSANFYFLYVDIHQTTAILVNFVLNKEHFVF